MTWQILLAALGLWFAIEGILYAAAPDVMKRMGEWLSQLPVENIRSGGIWSAILGLVLFYAAIRFF
ncbi:MULTISPECIES: DUF2065 domain-containing protein [Henriciella]|jgi:uncharacterized protein YjeT (DUF2065 family)|uniref:DUF2065 domain-containing protein n=1 Tax=Henriciella pelagia TaxID=1977912 RepID=A0ABQ1JEE2_9PROT|nr:DUF2065 domain-containing protein [Henriciella pelagia]GGB66842.1 hypothetical protein GCM10011503_14560 [Henriciella pelagia]